MIDHSLVYPAVAPRSYLVDLGEGACSYTDLGPNLIVMLSLDLDSALRNVAPAELADAGLTDDGAWDLALENLGKQVSIGRLQLLVVAFQNGEKAAYFEGHWLGSAAIYHNGLYPWFQKELASNNLLALVSERDSSVIFPADCSAFTREEVERFSCNAAANARKPFGRNLFRLEVDGPTFVE